MGACSSRSNNDAIDMDASRPPERYTARSRERTPYSLTTRGSSPSPLVSYLAELENNSEMDSIEFGARRRRWSPIAGPGDAIARRRSLTSGEPSRRQLSEIEELQQSLAAMEDFFQSLLGQAQLYMEAMDPSGGSGGGPPPASESAMRKLPLVSLTKDDMKIENNRICGICCEAHSVGDKVTAMPCGHVYHGPCIEAWLSRHCTCPVCRYEMKTDDASYEPGRLERMSERKTPCECHEIVELKQEEAAEEAVVQEVPLET